MLTTTITNIMCKITIIIRAIIINTIIIYRAFTAQTPTITTATSTLLYYCYNAADNDPVADDQSGNRAIAIFMIENLILQYSYHALISIVNNYIYNISVF